MQSISRVTRRLCRRPSVGPILSGATRCLPPSLARGDAPLKPAASALPSQLPDRLSRFSYEPWSMQHGIGVGCEKTHVKLDEGTMKGMDKTEAWKTQDVNDNVRAPKPIRILENSSHRDGAIFKGNWEDCYLMDIADRNETRFEKKYRPPDHEYSFQDIGCEMIQIFSLRLAKAPINSGPLELYGYMAARDDTDGMLNYIFNCSRDDPVTVQQGSLIQMTGPKRGILMLSDVLLEFDMRIKDGKKEEEDLQLIDGLIHLEERTTCRPFTVRINGSCGAVDMCLTLVETGVEAAIEVVISEVQSAFDLSISYFVSYSEALQEFQLFDGIVGESCGLKRFVVAFPVDNIMMRLKFKVGQKGSDRDVAHYVSFNTKVYGHVNRQIKLEQACISVKLAWSPPF